MPVSSRGRPWKQLNVDSSGRHPLSPHSLRHSAVTIAHDADVPLHIVQDMARHADPRTTRRYDQGRGNLDNHASYAIASALA